MVVTKQNVTAQSGSRWLPRHPGGQSDIRLDPDDVRNIPITIVVAKRSR